ncbi:hypothetical protein PMAYCL1PPCAC_03546, partial [Pristionchus mayeri]
MSLSTSIVLVLLIYGADASCSDHYTNLVSADSDASLLIVSDSTTFKCVYNVDTAVGPPETMGTCDLSCPQDSEVVALYAGNDKQVYLSAAHFDSTWTGQQTSSAIDLG